MRLGAVLAAADRLEGVGEQQFPTPLDVARLIDPTTVQTPALDIIDRALMAAVDGTGPKRLIISMPPQEGKLVDHDEMVPTPDGWRRHGDLAPGDLVYHPSGRPVRVTAISEDAIASMRVETSEGGSVVVHPAHEWTVYDRARGQWRTVETRELARRKLVSGGRNTIQLPARGVLEGSARTLPMDPYALGVWLGDGSTSKGAVTHHADDEYVLPYAVSSRHVHPTTGVVTTYYAGMWADLRAAGVARNKHIPDAYLWADAQSRWALLCGLIDSDGSIDERGQLLFANTNTRLARGVAQLIRSFGYRVGERAIAPRTSTSGIVGKLPVHVVTYSPTDGMVPARLPRKFAKVDGSALARRIAITAVTEVEPRPGRCITVDSPDGLYLVGEQMIPTHNSQRCSRFFPIWLLKRNPELRFALIGYQDAISRRWGKQIRNDITDHPALGLTLRADSKAANEWNLLGHRGGMVTSSIEGSLTGRPVDVMVIDDPHKDAKEADSELMRENIKEWWRTAASTRMPAGGGIVIVVQTRWHEDDLAGFLQGPDNASAKDWHLINIPARAEHDPDRGEDCKCGQRIGSTGVEMVCLGYDILGRKPGEYMISARGRSVEDWQQRERDAGSRGWSALYQGWPSPSEGSILKRGWWKYYTQPRHVELSNGVCRAIGANQVIMSVDCAFKDTDGSDYVVMGILGRRGADVWLLDMVRAKMDFEETCKQLVALAAKWPQAALKIVEEKANGAAVLVSLRKQVGGLVPYNPTDSKEGRARAVSPYVEAGNVWLPHPSLAPWVGSFVHECATFPNGAHDDQVDMLTQALIRLLLEGGGGGDFLAEMEAEQRQPSGDGDAAAGGTYWASTDHEWDSEEALIPALLSR